MLTTDVIYGFATRIADAIRFGTPRAALDAWREWRKHVALSPPRHGADLELQATVRELLRDQRLVG